MKQISELVAEFAGRKPVRTGSLIISVFGDAVSQHGSAVWLGSLIKVLEPFGLNQRQIRTAVFRLVKEDWLVARQLGRRSYYSFTETISGPEALREGCAPDLLRSLQPAARRSYYSFTETGQRHYEKAARRIYYAAALGQKMDPGSADIM